MKNVHCHRERPNLHALIGHGKERGARRRILSLHPMFIHRTSKGGVARRFRKQTLMSDITSTCRKAHGKLCFHVPPHGECHKHRCPLCFQTEVCCAVEFVDASLATCMCSDLMGRMCRIPRGSLGDQSVGLARLHSSRQHKFLFQCRCHRPWLPQGCSSLLRGRCTPRFRLHHRGR